MARKKGAKALKEQIAVLEAVVGATNPCAACGKDIAPDATTCPHCGAPVREVAELQARAAESLEDLGKHLAETAGEEPAALIESPPPAAPAPTTEDQGLTSVAAVAKDVEVPERDTPTEPEAPTAAVAPVEPEVVTEEAESPDLEGFIAGIEAEVGVEAPAPAARQAAPASAVRAVSQSPRRGSPAGSGRWAAAVAAGAVLYLLSLYLTTLLDRLLVASFMVLGTLLVVTGIRAKPGPPRGSGGARTASEYVCPLCGTGTSANAPECPTCGAIFET